MDWLRNVVLPLAASLCCLPAWAADGPPFQVQLDPAAAAIRAVTIAGR